MWIIAIWILGTIPLTQTGKTLYIEQLQTEDGYAELNVGRAKLVCRYNFIVHTINVNELQDLVHKSQEIINMLKDVEYTRIAKDEISEMQKIINMLRPHRFKRGLINAGGSALKFIWGVMDDDDRKLIEEHQRVITENNHRLVQGFNQQILINDAFNRSIVNLKNAITLDREHTVELMESIKTLNNGFMNNELATQQLFKVQHLKQKIRDIADEITNAKAGVFSPILLTQEEVETFGIDLVVLKNIKTSLVEWVNDDISIVIKVPAELMETIKKLIVPIPNAMQNQIAEEPETVIEAKGEVLKFEEGRALFELQTSNHCTLKRRCKITKNVEPQIIEIDSSMILLINARNLTFNSTCDQRRTELSGHFFLHFNNCTVHMGNCKFSNKIVESRQTFVIPNPPRNITTERVLTYEEIVLQQQNNIKTIEEVKFNNMISTTTSGLSIGIILALTVTIVILCRRRASVKVNIKEKQNITRRALRSSQIKREFANSTENTQEV